MRHRLALKPGYARLFDGLTAALAGAGLVHVSGSEIVTAPSLPRPLDRGELAREKDRLAAAYPGFGAHLELAWTCLDRYPELLSGAVAATDVIFPSSSMALVEPLYRDNALSQHANGLVATAVRAYVEARLADGSGPVRIPRSAAEPPGPRAR